MDSRTIGFYLLSLSHEEIERPIQASLTQLLRFIESQERIKRKIEFRGDKIALLDLCSFSRDDNPIKLLFKSAKHSYRAPLIDKDTVEERDNPKRMNEGEQIKTHALIKFSRGRAILLLETGLGRLSSEHIVDYLNQMKSLHNRQYEGGEQICGIFKIYIMPRDDFREVLNSMTRVSCATIYTDSRILGSEFLNYANVSEEVREEVILEIKAERSKSIIQVAYDLLTHSSRSDSTINRVKVKGKLPNGSEAVIDTDFMLKKETITADRNPDTGEYSSPYIFSQLVHLSEQF